MRSAYTKNTTGTLRIPSADEMPEVASDTFTVQLDEEGIMPHRVEGLPDI